MDYTDLTAYSSRQANPFRGGWPYQLLRSGRAAVAGVELCIDVDPVGGPVSHHIATTDIDAAKQAAGQMIADQHEVWSYDQPGTVRPSVEWVDDPDGGIIHGRVANMAEVQAGYVRIARELEALRDGAAPVGVTEIAHRLGVERQTADNWRQRPGTGFPAPDWTVGGRPAWRWATIEAWARATDRL